MQFYVQKFNISLLIKFIYAFGKMRVELMNEFSSKFFKLKTFTALVLCMKITVHNKESHLT